MASNNILNSLRSSTLANALAEVASASDVQLYETAIGMSAIKGVSANTSVLPPQSVAVATTVTSGQVYTINIPRNGWMHGVVVKIEARGAASTTITSANGGLYPHLTDCSIIRGGQVIMPMNGAAALCSFSKYLEGAACDRLIEASLGGDGSLATAANETCYLLIPFDFMYDKSLSLDTLYCEQLQLRLSFNTSAFGVQALTAGFNATPFGACSVNFHYFDLDPDVANQLRQKVYAQSEAHSFLSNGWYQYPAVSSATAVNLNSQNLVKHIFYITTAAANALVANSGSHTVSAGGQTLQIHETISDMLAQRILFNPKTANSSNALSALIGCFDFTNAQNTESDAYSSGLSLRNIADPRLTPSSVSSQNYIVVECYYNLVSISSAGGQVMVAATS